MDVATIGIMCTVAGLLVGAVAGHFIGYYKAKSDFSADYVRREDCERCADQRAEKQRDVDRRIDVGAAMFAEINSNIAVILTKLERLERSAFNG